MTQKAIELAMNKGLVITETKDGSKAIVGFKTFEEAEDFARENEGLVVLLRQKYGWDVWECKGSSYGPIEIDQSLFGDNALGWTNLVDEDEFVDDVIATLDVIKPDTMEELQKFVEKRAQTWRIISKLQDDEILIESDGYEGDCEVFSKFVTFYDDERNSTRYQTAVI